MGATNQKTAIKPKDKLLSKISLFFFDRQVLSAFLWLSLTIFGILSYGTLMNREGFPSVNVPLVIVNGVYFANDADKVDSDVVVPIIDVINSRDDVSSMQSTGGANFFAITINFKEGVDSTQAASELRSQLESAAILPPTANVNYSVPYFGATGGDVDKIDVAISLYDKTGNASTEVLTQQASLFADRLDEENLSLVDDAFVKSPYESTTNPLDGSTVEVLRSFDRYGERHDDETQ
ncbi:efflux RND transporter permease subunit, partial [Candidatus Saccharibacteria bacterium]|nr:efflux RND transporter permease subunit [Candidatus Saccharibacteria bacterium]